MSSPGEDHASSPSNLNPSTSTTYAPFDHNDNIIAANEALVLYCRRYETIGDRTTNPYQTLSAHSRTGHAHSCRAQT